MVEHVSDDDWKYETLPDGRRVSVYDVQDIDQGDIRHQTYALDVRKWCLEYYWTPEQAAMISFDRDPDKFLPAQFVPWDEEDEQFEEHRKLINAMEKRCELITAAQNRGTLDTPFRSEMFVQWSKHVGHPLPHLQRELGFIERERRGEVTPIKHFPGMYIEADEAPEIETDQPQAIKGKGPQKRLDNNVTKILLAILKKSNLLDSDVKKLSETLSDILSEMKSKRGDKSFSLSAPVIEQRLVEAHDLLK